MEKTLITKAINFASTKHAGQLDDDGRPYIDHPIMVADLIRLIAPNDEVLIAAAYLHDVLEDTDATYHELVMRFGKEVADLVYEVTHEGKKETGYYFPRLKSQRGIMLKFADRLSNISRMDPWDEKRKLHYLRTSRFWKTDDGKSNTKSNS